MHIREYPNLCASLGAAKVDTVAFHQADVYAPTKRARIVNNPHRKRLMWKPFGEDKAVDDILSGIARLDYGTEQGLNPVRLYVLLQSAERISSELIVDVMGLQERQGRRYLAAARLAITQLTRHFENNPLEVGDDTTED
ncbi:hypothetical protein [Pseudomonas phage 98PfluR60PP]|uniref:Uncharacterized protein n=1 Tax=Pseudomonas phage 98PfluR60PP TaxID=2163965 RepID=A0A2S1PFW7_9CAUD|nr:hypothetical protein PP760_gp30 [Pseudomonas phage 98PfluR60PP]AWH15462.1 hypothetical protein [Pseudomonas phage 98PfluR60PP]